MKSDFYETNIWDHLKMIITVLRKTFAKGKQKTIVYRCYKYFDEGSFNEALNSRIPLPNWSFEKIFEIFQSTLDFFAPCKQRKIRNNNNLFMTKRLRKEIMLRSKLSNKFNKPSTSVNLQNCRKQRNNVQKF